MNFYIAFCALIGLVHSAPEPCINLCGSSGDLKTKTSESSQTYRIHGTLTDQNALRDLHQSLIMQSQKSDQIDLNSNRPGNWTEHNDYITDNGTGSVHEERGQIVNSASKINYHSKNYESSYGTGVLDMNNAAASQLSNNYLNVHSAIDRNNMRNYQQSTYNSQNLHDISHPSSSSSIDNLARIENFDEQQNTQIHENSGSTNVQNTGDDWTRHNSYETDGGHGKVYEEEGQYRRGSAKVRYYKKNYTSSYSSADGDGGMPTLNIPRINIDQDERIRELKTHLEQIHSDINQRSRHSSTQDVRMNRNYDRTESSLPSQNLYVQPVTHVTSFNSHREVEGQTYIPMSNINRQVNYPTNREGVQYQQQQQRQRNEDTTIRIPVYRRDGAIHIDSSSDNSHSYNSQLDGNRRHREHISVEPHVGNQYEEHWRSSEYRSHSTIPHQVASGQEILNGQNLQNSNQQYQSSLHGDYENFNRARSNDYISSGSTLYSQRHDSEIRHGNIHSGMSQHGYHGADCDDSTHAEYNTHHGNVRYKRGADYSQQSENLNQETENLQFNQQQVENLALEHQQSTNGFGEYTQQHVGNLELEYPQSTHGFEEYTQQHIGDLKLKHQQNAHEFGEHTQQQVGNLKLEHQQSTHGFGEYTQQQIGNLKLEHKERTHGSEELTQHVGNSGLDHQQIVHEFKEHSQHVEDLQLEQQQSTQVFGELNQPLVENLELVQQHDTHGIEEFNQQQVENSKLKHEQHMHGLGGLTQQHVGNVELQDHQSSHEFGQVTQQQHIGNLDLEHQRDTHEFGEYTQQHMGNLELEQQQNTHEFEEHSQQASNLELEHQQSTHGFGEYTQQHMGNLELEQQQNTHGFEEHSHQASNLELEHQQITDNFGEYTQQHMGNLELEQQQNTHEFEEHSQQASNLDLEHQHDTHEFGEYTQQHVSNLELDHQKSAHEIGEFNQQQVENLESEPQQNTYEFGKVTPQHIENLELEYQQNTHGLECMRPHGSQVDHQKKTQKIGESTEPYTGNLELEHQQNTYGSEKFTQQHIGNLKLEHQQPKHEFGEFNQKVESLGLEQQQQNTHGFDGHIQQHYGNVDFIQQDIIHPTTIRFEDYTEPSSDNIESEQQRMQQYQSQSQVTNPGLIDSTQQQSEKKEVEQKHHQSEQIEFGKQSDYQNHKIYSQIIHQNIHDHSSQYPTQQTTQKSEDYSQQSSGKLELNQQYQHGQIEINQQFGHQSPKSSGQYRHQNSHGHMSPEIVQQGIQEFEDYIRKNYGNLNFGQLDEYQNGQQHDKQNIGTYNYKQQIHGTYYNRGQQTDASIQQSHSTQSTEIKSDSQLSDNDFERREQLQSNIDHEEEHQYNYEKSTPKLTTESQKVEHIRGDIQSESVPRPVGVKGGHRRISAHHPAFNSPHSQLDKGNVVSLEEQVRKDEPLTIFEPRILEAYGGNGPYSVNHHADIYAEAKLNPTATLAPLVNGKDSWDVREVSVNEYVAKNHGVESMMFEVTTKVYPEEITTVAPGFWKRLGHKITRTYEKAKEKVGGVFG